MPEHILEKEQRLSHSLLWTLQETAYKQFGVSAWSSQGVPFYITSNPYTARCYAQVILGYLKDLIDSQKLDISHPVYILDLGAGTGRFAFLFLKELFRLLQDGALAHLIIRYVMTDIVESNLDFVREHRDLAIYFQNGIADTAILHHAQTFPIKLMGSGEILDSKVLVNPLIAIGNYFFDTIPQDLFRVHLGVLEEGRVTLYIEDDKVPSHEDPSVINRVQWRYTYRPCTGIGGYYADPAANAVLNEYNQEMDGSTFLFPIGAFQVVQLLLQLSRGRLFFIAGDQGVCTRDQIRAWGEPKLALHGSFSMAVSYHAIAAYLKQCGGFGMLTTHSDPKFVVMAGIFSDEKTFDETVKAFYESIDSFEPVDYWRMVTSVENDWKKPSLEFLLKLVKLGNWDPMSFHAFFPALREGIARATELQKEQLAKAIDKVAENFYSIAPVDGEFILNLGVLCFDLKRYEKAIIYFERSLEITGPNPAAMKNINASRNCLNKP